MKQKPQESIEISQILYRFVRNLKYCIRSIIGDFLILTKKCINQNIAYLVTNLIRMSFADAFCNIRTFFIFHSVASSQPISCLIHLLTLHIFYRCWALCCMPMPFHTSKHNNSHCLQVLYPKQMLMRTNE